MAQRLVLHVGAMKSGTSYLQGVLFANKDHLARQGVLVPGEAWGDQERAVRQVVTRRAGRRPAWDDLAEQVRAAPGTCVVSMEYLAPLPPRRATRILAGLRVPEVDVVLTARDLNRSLVSLWQETVQNGRTWTFSAYLADARDKRPGRERGVSDRETAGGTFWRQQHLARLAQDWTSVVGADRFTLVTVPPPGAAPDLLARRFAQATDLPIAATGAPSGGNESLGLASALALRRVNELLDERGLAFPAGSSLRKRLLAKTVLAARRDQEPRLGLPVSDWVRAQSADTVAELRHLGARLVGDWDDLLPVAVPGVDVASVSDAEVADAALAGLAGLIAEQLTEHEAP